MQTFRALAFTGLFYGWTTLFAIAVLPLLFGPPRALWAYGRFWIRGAKLAWILPQMQSMPTNQSK